MTLWLGWLGTVLLMIASWNIGNKRRFAHLITIVGETCWIVKAVATGQYDLAVVCVLFAVLASRSWLRWGMA